jgi:hypothetical protein
LISNDVIIRQETIIVIYLYLLELACAPEEVIQTKMKGGYYGLVLPDVITDYKSNSNPFNLYGKVLFSEFSPK